MASIVGISNAIQETGEKPLTHLVLLLYSHEVSWFVKH